jgi:hypothetical protein
VVVVYAALAVSGLTGTWWFNLQVDSGGVGGYLGDWFATPASSSAAVDVLVVAVAAVVFILAEGRRLGMRRVWVLALMTPLTAVAFTFPLFLALRERRLGRASRPLPPASPVRPQEVRP